MERLDCIYCGMKFVRGNMAMCLECETRYHVAKFLGAWGEDPMAYRPWGIYFLGQPMPEEV